MLRFFDQILEGEIKQTTPRWPGIEGIGEIIEDINNEVENLRAGTLDSLNEEITKIGQVKLSFSRKMESSGETFSKTEVIQEYSNPYDFNIDGRGAIKGTFD